MLVEEITIDTAFHWLEGKTFLKLYDSATADICEQFKSKTEKACIRIKCREEELSKFVLPFIKGLSLQNSLLIAFQVDGSVNIDCMSAFHEIANQCEVASASDTLSSDGYTTLIVGFFTKEVAYRYSFAPISDIFANRKTSNEIQTMECDS